MNATLMRDYVEYIADYLLKQLGFPALFKKPNPVRAIPTLLVHVLMHFTRQFPFMETSAVSSRTNFFERSVSDYVGVTLSRTDDSTWAM